MGNDATLVLRFLATVALIGAGAFVSFLAILGTGICAYGECPGSGLGKGLALAALLTTGLGALLMIAEATRGAGRWVLALPFVLALTALSLA